MIFIEMAISTVDPSVGGLPLGFCSPSDRELKSTRVANSRFARLGNRARADLAERRPQLVDIEIDEIVRPLVTKRGHRPEERLAGESGVRSERQRPHHV